MKKTISLFILTLMIVSLQAVTKVEVYYFHYSRRCITCQAVENETLKSIQQLYPEQFKKGLITFKSVNLDEKNSEDLAKKCKAEGQALLVISGGKRIDLTEQGFMYAKSQPDKLKAELKKTIDPLF
ncbi:MAG: nitrophenyl compound nitroreductase subunit ArsF family protein [Paludibacter sp.]